MDQVKKKMIDWSKFDFSTFDWSTFDFSLIDHDIDDEEAQANKSEFYDCLFDRELDTCQWNIVGHPQVRISQDQREELSRLRQEYKKAFGYDLHFPLSPMGDYTKRLPYKEIEFEKEKKIIERSINEDKSLHDYFPIYMSSLVRQQILGVPIERNLNWKNGILQEPQAEHFS
jgi:hypothetical protein